MSICIIGFRFEEKKTASLDVRLAVAMKDCQKLLLVENNAEEESRTPTPLRALRPERSVYTISPLRLEVWLILPAHRGAVKG